MAADTDIPLILGKYSFTSRLIVGTDECKSAIQLPEEDRVSKFCELTKRLRHLPPEDTALFSSKQPIKRSLFRQCFVAKTLLCAAFPRVLAPRPDEKAYTCLATSMRKVL